VWVEAEPIGGHLGPLGLRGQSTHSVRSQAVMPEHHLRMARRAWLKREEDPKSEVGSEDYNRRRAQYRILKNTVGGRGPK